MKIFPALATCLSLMLAAASPALAADITYPGYPLGPDFENKSDSLFPPASSPSGNTVTITGGSIAEAYSSQVLSGDVSGNALTITGGVVNGSIWGAATHNGTAFNNTVTMSGGSVVSDVHGAYSQGGDATNNRTVITGGRVGRIAYGAQADSGGNAIGNEVSLSGDAVVTSARGGWASSGNALNNRVYLDGNASVGFLTGGESGGVAGSTSGNLASGNEVHVLGGSVSTRIRGGHTYNGDAVNNLVRIHSPAYLAPTVDIHGGDTTVAGGDVFTGNTLDVLAFRGTVNSVQNFQFYNFSLPGSLGNGQTQVGIAGAAATDLTNATVTLLGVEGGGIILQPGDSVTLLGEATGMADFTTSVPKGSLLTYDFLVSTASGALTASLSKAELVPGSAALPEGRIAGLAFANQGADLIVGPGMAGALACAMPGEGWNTFGATQGGWSRYKTGSHVDVGGVSLLAGLARKTPLPVGNLTLGGFLEAGWGEYDTHNSFNNAASVNGDGDTRYYGGGILGCLELSNGLYMQASGRVGRADTHFSSGDMRDGMGQEARYDYGALYYGAHAGIGYLFRFNERALLDVSSKYLWTRLEDDNTHLSTGESVHFSSSESQRWRTGARFSHAVTGTVTPYIGAAYEYEFDGKARATAEGYRLRSADLKGGTGIGEAGISIMPAHGEGGLTLDLGIQGYVGTREGLTGSVQLKWEF
ncbi:exported hypothetical protein [uncultured delta proteobacterium]|uniref:Autotransporter domain-containing protein n=1 Tax=uncultured delta proteobacterium TaxID=34034 RepID=A0A212JTZ6_9DELT|nr:exported hypothetical protein [uncultured delta proteobacterium]